MTQITHELQTRKIGEVTIIDCDIDRIVVLNGGPDLLRNTVRGLIDNKQTRLILNLEKVDYMDSNGLGQMVVCWRDVKEARGHLKLLSLTNRVRTLIHRSNLHTIFEIFESDKENDAVESFK